MTMEMNCYIYLTFLQLLYSFYLNDEIEKALN